MKLDPNLFRYVELQEKEIHAFYRSTRIFIMKEKRIGKEPYWTCKSCLSYVPSMKEKTLEAAKQKITEMTNEFIALFFPQSQEELNKHPQAEFRCPICGSDFSSQGELDKHEERFHPEY